MSENRVSFTITEADISDILAAIKTLQTKLLPYLIALAADDKRAIPKVGDKAIPFMLKGLEFMVSHPEFVPAYLDVGEIKKDYDAFSLVNSFLRQIAPTVSNMEDTAFLCAAEAYQGVLTYYNNVKQAAKTNVPNAKAVYEELRNYFDDQQVKPLKPEKPKE
ncbi:MAG TPA: hypothetical protein PKY59_27130 [Pyrinomonadaceae bacterium]|nr:hypothetical protein [Pyrinomonadaceae bacterium]